MANTYAEGTTGKNGSVYSNGQWLYGEAAKAYTAKNSTASGTPDSTPTAAPSSNATQSGGSSNNGSTSSSNSTSGTREIGGYGYGQGTSTNKYVGATSDKYGDIQVYYDSTGALDHFIGADGVKYSKADLDSGTKVHAANGKDYVYVAAPDQQTGGDRTVSASTASDYGVQNGREAFDESRGYLDQWRKAAEDQAILQNDYATQRAIIEQQRTLADSNDYYRTELGSIARDEMNARDNSALYSELRGDKGGIGQAQYDQIAATAMQNRQSVQTAQNKLATDTQRAITDLRAQGEFEKADKLLEISQTYMSQLMNLYQWSSEYGLSVAQFNEAMKEWAAEFNEKIYEYDTNMKFNYDQFNESIRQYDQNFNEGVREFDKNFSLNEANLTGMYQNNPTYKAMSDNAELLYTTGNSSGYVQLWKSMGYSDSMIASMKKSLDQFWAAQNMPSGGGGGVPTVKTVDDMSQQEKLYNMVALSMQAAGTGLDNYQAAVANDIWISEKVAAGIMTEQTAKNAREDLGITEAIKAGNKLGYDVLTGRENIATADAKNSKD